jgi:chromate transporter
MSPRADGPVVSQPDGKRAPAAQPPLWSMLVQVLYIGTIGYGGPTALTSMRNIFVTERAWFTEDEFLEAMGLSQVLPGSTGVTAMNYFGHRRYGYFGALVFPLVFLAPSIAAPSSSRCCSLARDRPACATGQ